MTNEKLSLADYCAQHPNASRFFRRNDPANYDDFVDVLYDDINDLIKEFERTSDARKDDTEDRLSLDLCVCLSRLTYFATHDTHAGGRVDLTVVQRTKDFRWIGEAKIFRSVTDMREGFLQLVDRYVSPPPEDKAGLIAYIKRPNAAAQMKAWRNELNDMNVAALSFEECSRRPNLHFFSSHVHDRTGLPLIIWHICVILSHTPTDKSARGRKK